MLLNVRLLHAIVVCAGLSARKFEVFSTYTDKHWYRHHQIRSIPLILCNGFLGAKLASIIYASETLKRMPPVPLNMNQGSRHSSKHQTRINLSSKIRDFRSMNVVGIGAVWKYCHKWCWFHAPGAQYILFVTATGRATPEIYTYNKNIIGTFCLVPLNGLLDRSTPPNVEHVLELPWNST